MKRIYTLISFFLIATFFAGCSAKKDGFLNRKYHALATKYNVLYNGNIALEKGLTQLKENYQDDYYSILPIEPLNVDEIVLPGINSSSNSSPKEFEKAEEKAVKAIQKHSMRIDNRQRNSQIDDAYLLLGKARYYSKNYVPALEAFNYIIINYPKASLINETRIWQAKTLVRLQNEIQAADNLKALIENVELKKETSEKAYTALAMAYLSIDSIQQGIYALKKATETDEDVEQTARNLFILGQLFRNQQQIDSSTIAFNNLIALKKVPQKYKVRAYLELAKNTSDKLEALTLTETLQKLIKDRDNRPYLSELYYQYGLLSLESNSKKAEELFKKSLEYNTQSTFQKELTYQALGDMYFNQSDFIKAGKYYDSILSVSKDINSKRIRSLTRKRKNLSDVIKYEEIAQRTDSILTIVDMNQEEQVSYFNKIIDKLVSERMQGNDEIIVTKSQDNVSSGKWYFYNNQTVSFGEKQFKNIWGNRPLEDNWRLSTKTTIENTTAIVTSEKITLESIPKLTDFLNKIPTSTLVLDSLRLERVNAFFDLGVIYKEQYSKYDLAKDYLEKTIALQPEEEIILPAKFHLFKIYEIENNPKAEKLKADIIENYSTSLYANLIINPNQTKEEEVSLAESEYALLYYDYKDEKYDEVILKSTEAIEKYEGQTLIPKFELLKAYAIGKKQGAKAFKDALDFIVLNFPNTEEGKKALEVIETLKNIN